MSVVAAGETAAFGARGGGGWGFIGAVDGFALERGGGGVVGFDFGALGGDGGVGGIGDAVGRGPGDRARGHAGVTVLPGGLVPEELLVGAGLALERGLVQRDLLVADLAPLGRGGLPGLLGFEDHGQELDAGEGLELLVAVTVLGFVELTLDQVQDRPHLGEGAVRARVWHQEPLPAGGDAVRVAAFVPALFGQSVLFGFAQVDGPGADFAPVFKRLQLGAHQTQLDEVPVLGIFGAVLESLVVLAAPEDPEVVGQVPRAGLVAAEDVGNDFAVVTGVGDARGDCYTSGVDMLRRIVVGVYDLDAVHLQTLSTKRSVIVKFNGGTDQGSIAGATVNVGVVQVLLFVGY